MENFKLLFFNCGFAFITFQTTRPWYEAIKQQFTINTVGQIRIKEQIYWLHLLVHFLFPSFDFKHYPLKALLTSKMENFVNF